MHTTEVKVRFSELDPYGHVNHAVYLTYLETARIEALASIGYDLATLRGAGLHLIVVELSVRYHLPAGLGDVLRIETAVAERRPASSRWRQCIRRGDDLLASAELRGAITGLDGRARRAPDGFRDALAPLCAPAPTAP